MLFVVAVDEKEENREGENEQEEDEMSYISRYMYIRITEIEESCVFTIKFSQIIGFLFVRRPWKL